MTPSPLLLANRTLDASWDKLEEVKLGDYLLDKSTKHKSFSFYIDDYNCRREMRFESQNAFAAGSSSEPAVKLLKRSLNFTAKFRGVKDWKRGGIGGKSGGTERGGG